MTKEKLNEVAEAYLKANVANPDLIVRNQVKNAFMAGFRWAVTGDVNMFPDPNQIKNNE